MYTILVKDNNELVTTVKERIMQRSKLVDNLHFLVDQTYKNVDMSDFVVTMEYILPISREYKIETLVKSDELYKEKIEYTLPFDTCLTKEHGKIEVQLTFTKVAMDADGNVVQQVRKTSPTSITIVPIAAWSNMIADSDLTALDQRIIMTQAMVEAANETLAAIEMSKADNIVYDKDTNVLQLTANGNPIGDKIVLNTNIDVHVKCVEVDVDGNLIVTYSNGTTENVGKTGGQECVGVYVPSYSRDGIMTFTLQKEAKDDILDFDINPHNDWNEISAPEASSNYLWRAL